MEYKEAPPSYMAAVGLEQPKGPGPSVPPPLYHQQAAPQFPQQTSHVGFEQPKGPGPTVPPPLYHPQAAPQFPQQSTPQFRNQTTNQGAPLQQVSIVYSRGLGPYSQSLQCPSCHELIQTRLNHQASTKTHLLALIICLVFWPCVWLPYAADQCKDADHYCPSCGAYLGTYSP